MKLIAEMVGRRRDGHTWRQIADWAGLPISTVRNRVKAAMAEGTDESLMRRQPVREMVNMAMTTFAELRQALAVGATARASMWTEELGEVLGELSEHVGL